MRQPGRATPQAKLETLNAIQLFRNVRAQVSAWMPPAGQEAALFRTNAAALSVEMLCESDTALTGAEKALEKLARDFVIESVGT